MPFTIDNPGGGDCGFYAFAIGLIDIIQKESQKSKSPHSRSTYKTWLNSDKLNVSLEQILKIDLTKLEKSPYSYEKNVLNELQMSLRAIAANSFKNALFNKLKQQKDHEKHSPGTGTYIESTWVFTSFMELVYSGVNEKVLSSGGNNLADFNVLSLSEEVKKLAKKAADRINQDFSKNMSFKDKQTLMDKVGKTFLLADVSQGSEKDNGQSVILKAMDVVKAPKQWWATHGDLNNLAQTFSVNLYVNGACNGTLTKAQPTVKLINHFNGHWTTAVDSVVKQHQKLVESKLSLEVKKPAKPKLSSVVKKPVESQSTSVVRKPVESKSNAAVKKLTKSKLSSEAKKTAEPKLSLAEKKKNYESLKSSLITMSKQGFFKQAVSKEEKAIDINDIDSAEAFEKELDESFAMRLQEAELRRAGY